MTARSNECSEPVKSRLNAFAQRWGLMAPLTLTLIWALSTAPWLSGDKLIPHDAVDEFYPGVVFAVESLLRGELPFWNPYVFSGYPSLADPQGMTFSPSMVLPMLLDRSIAWFTTLILIHVLFGGLGVLRLGRIYGWSIAARLLAAVIFMFGGVAAARLQHTPMIVTWVLLPWLIILVRKLADDGRWRFAIALGVVGGLAGLQLTQVTFLGALVVGAYAVYRFFVTKHERYLGSSSVLYRYLAAVFIAGLISSPQIVATVSFLPYTNRPEFDFSAATANSLDISAFLTLVSPNAIGNVRGPYVGGNDMTESFLYVGALPLALIIIGLLTGKRSLPGGEFRFWIALIVLSTIYALGGHTPVYQWLHAYVPGVNLFRRPTDGVFMLIFGLAVIAGSCFDAWVKKPEIDRNTFRLLACIVAIEAACIVAIGPLLGTYVSWLSLVFLVVGFWCLKRAQTARRALWWTAAALCCVFVDLRASNLNNRLNAHRYAQYHSREALRNHPSMSIAEARLRQEAPSYFRIDVPGELWIGVASIFRVPVVNGISPLLIKEYAEITGIGPNPMQLRRPSGAFDSYAGKLNDLLGVRYLILSTAAERRLQAELLSYRLVERVESNSDERYSIWKNESALPRVLRPTRVLPSPGPAAFTPELLRGIDLRDTAYIDAPIDELELCGRGHADVALISRYGNTEVILQVRTEHASWVILNDAYLDGWYAEIAGMTVPIRRANGLFRAVCVPAGTQHVQFSFQPYRALLHRIRNLV